MAELFVEPALSLQGELHLPGDKSMSHRALLLALVSTKPVTISNLGRGQDVESTIAVIEQLGATVERDAREDLITVTGVGLTGLRTLDDGEVINCGNAGTLARLLPGILAGQAGRSYTLVGDESLSKRPMERVVVPLQTMGATFEIGLAATLPMTITGAESLKAISYTLPQASAQVQGAVLLAGLYADAPVKVIEPAIIRDHTERMLRASGVKVRRTTTTVTIEPATDLQLPDITLPGDPSAGAPFAVAASILRGSLLRLPAMMDNPGRRGLYDILENMGTGISFHRRTQLGTEAVYDVEVRGTGGSRLFIETSDIARMIDEVPLLAVLGQFRRGETIVRGAGELRVKESDRIATLELAMKAVGISFQPLRDGFIARGSLSRPVGGRVYAEGDHRMAMLAAVVGLVSKKGVTIDGSECVDVSFPGFFDILDTLAVR